MDPTSRRGDTDSRRTHRSRAGRQILVQIAEMVLAELSGGIPCAFSAVAMRHGLGRHTDIGAGLTDRRQTGAHRNLAGDEVGPARRATRLGIVVGEHHALGGQLVEVRRLAGHHAPVIGADIEPADVVAHDDHDIGPALLLLGGCWNACHRHREEQPQKAEPNCSADHDRTPILFPIKSGTSRRARAGGWVYFIGDKRVSWTKGQQFTRDLYAGRCPL